MKDNKSWRNDKRTAAQRGYNSRWNKARKTYLDKNPLCVFCLRDGRYSAANTVDHKTAHEGCQRLFWSRDNWQSLCSTCHSSKKQRAEKRGVNVENLGGDITGAPKDPNSHWYK